MASPPQYYHEHPIHAANTAPVASSAGGAAHIIGALHQHAHTASTLLHSEKRDRTGSGVSAATTGSARSAGLPDAPYGAHGVRGASSSWAVAAAGNTQRRAQLPPRGAMDAVGSNVPLLFSSPPRVLADDASTVGSGGNVNIASSAHGARLPPSFGAAPAIGPASISMWSTADLRTGSSTRGHSGDNGGGGDGQRWPGSISDTDGGTAHTTGGVAHAADALPITHRALLRTLLDERRYTDIADVLDGDARAGDRSSLVALSLIAHGINVPLSLTYTGLLQPNDTGVDIPALVAAAAATTAAPAAGSRVSSSEHSASDGAGWWTGGGADSDLDGGRSSFSGRRSTRARQSTYVQRARPHQMPRTSPHLSVHDPVDFPSIGGPVGDGGRRRSGAAASEMARYRSSIGEADIVDTDVWDDEDAALGGGYAARSTPSPFGDADPIVATLRRLQMAQQQQHQQQQHLRIQQPRMPSRVPSVAASLSETSGSGNGVLSANAATFVNAPALLQPIPYNMTNAFNMLTMGLDSAHGVASGAHASMGDTASPLHQQYSVAGGLASTASPSTPLGLPPLHPRRNSATPPASAAAARMLLRASFGADADGGAALFDVSGSAADDYSLGGAGVRDDGTGEVDGDDDDGCALIRNLLPSERDGMLGDDGDIDSGVILS